MSNEVQFDFDDEKRPEYKMAPPKITQWVMRYSGGLIKDEMQATHIILGFVALAASASLLLFFSGKEKPYQPSLQEMSRSMTMPDIGVSTK